jgi:hypothetical protein
VLGLELDALEGIDARPLLQLTQQVAVVGLADLRVASALVAAAAIAAATAPLPAVKWWTASIFGRAIAVVGSTTLIVGRASTVFG